MTNLWHDVDRKSAEEFNVIVEIPKKSGVKYEIDKDTGLLCFDRVMHSAVHYPQNYGFVPRTYWDDGDALDVLVVTRHVLVPGCLVKCRPVGILKMNDTGEPDEKILAVPVDDHHENHIQDVNDISAYLLEEIKHFFKIYKELKGDKVEVGDILGKEEAIKAVKRSFTLYDEKFSN